jgi:hypothetical protein
MQQTPPPQLPWPAPEPPARPAVVPIVPTSRPQPGRQAPLPDAVAVRWLVVPDAAPPYDDEQPDGTEPDNTEPDKTKPDGTEPGHPEQPPDDGPGPDEPGADELRPARQLPPDPTGLWASQFAQVVAETLAGSRPARQLTPWTTEQTRQRIRQLGPTLVADQRPRVRRIVTSAPSQDVLELTAVVGFGPRVRALALRLERIETRPYRTTGERWCCTAIESA